MHPTFPTMTACAIALACAFSASSATAHDLWVNAMAADPVGHGDTTSDRSVVVTSVGWGHAPLPLSEFLPGARISAYHVITPDGASIALPFDAKANASVTHELEGWDGINLQAGDALMRRMVLDGAAAEGAWRVHLANPARVFTTWIDADGERQSGAHFVDEIEGAEQIISSAVSVRDATAWWRHGRWSQPGPAGTTLEMLPLANPTALQVGDALDVQLVWNGAEAVISEAVAGRASFSMPVADAGDAFADYEGRIATIDFITTMTVTIRP